jgi:hypothetical protein
MIYEIRSDMGMLVFTVTKIAVRLQKCRYFENGSATVKFTLRIFFCGVLEWETW